jgi:nicotinamidase-related amidase
MQSVKFDSKTTALIAIDLQHGIVGRTLAPHSAADVVERTKRVADALRAKGGTIVFVHVEIREVLRLPVDAPMVSDPNAAPPPANASQLVPEIGLQEGDLVVKKRQWGAFYGTDLEQWLRRKGIRTILMTGIATNFGVESTARAAFDRGYELIFVEDAISSMTAEMHEFPVKTVFPRMGRVRSTAEVLAELAGH